MLRSTLRIFFKTWVILSFSAKIFTGGEFIRLVYDNDDLVLKYCEIEC